MIDAVLAYPMPSKESPSLRPALGIFYVGAMLERAGMKVEYFDERFDHLSKFESIIRRKPLVVGISSMTGYQLVGTKKLLETAKRIYPEIPTVLGGVHPSILPNECISENDVDFVVVGEGEKTFLHLIKAIKEEEDLGQIKGIWWKKNGKALDNGAQPFIEPKEWPFPMTEKNMRYFELAAQSGELMYQSSRGCPYDCKFCYNVVFNKRTWRKAPLEKVESELQIMTDKLSFDRIMLCDDNIGVERNRIIELSKIFKRFDIKWFSSIRTEVDVELLRILEKNNCYHLLLGIESGSDRILKDVIGKRHTVKDIRKCTKAFAQVGVRGRYNFIYGLPGDTLKDLYMSMELADWILKKDKNAIVVFDAYVPYPGTVLYKKAIKNGFREPEGMTEWSKMNMSNPINKTAEAIYFISGLKTRGKRGDLTSTNFPGFKRLLILPFEILAHIRWRLRFLSFYKFEKYFIQKLFAYATKH